MDTKLLMPLHALNKVLEPTSNTIAKEEESHIPYQRYVAYKTSTPWQSIEKYCKGYNNPDIKLVRIVLDPLTGVIIGAKEIGGDCEYISPMGGGYRYTVNIKKKAPNKFFFVRDVYNDKEYTVYALMLYNNTACYNSPYRDCYECCKYIFDDVHGKMYKYSNSRGFEEEDRRKWSGIVFSKAMSPLKSCLENSLFHRDLTNFIMSEHGTTLYKSGNPRAIEEDDSRLNSNGLFTSDDYQVVTFNHKNDLIGKEEFWAVAWPTNGDFSKTKVYRYNDYQFCWAKHAARPQSMFDISYNYYAELAKPAMCGKYYPGITRLIKAGYIKENYSFLKYGHKTIVKYYHALESLYRQLPKTERRMINGMQLELSELSCQASQYDNVKAKLAALNLPEHIQEILRVNITFKCDVRYAYNQWNDAWPCDQVTFCEYLYRMIKAGFTKWADWEEYQYILSAANFFREYHGESPLPKLPANNRFADVFDKAQRNAEAFRRLKSEDSEQFTNSKLQSICESEKYQHLMPKSNNEYCCVAADSIDKFKEEGTKLEHCVYALSYYVKMAEGNNLMFFIRKVDEPDTPFYTLELIGNKIQQCNGFQNTRNLPVTLREYLLDWANEHGLNADNIR